MQDLRNFIRLSKNVSLDSRVAELESTVAEVRAVNQEHMENISVLSTKQNQEEEVARLQETLLGIETELDRRTSSLQEAVNRSSDLEAQLSSLHAQLDTVRRSEEELGLEKARREEECRKAEMKVDRLVEERDSADQERRELNKEVENLRSLISEISTENETLQGSVSESESTVATLQARLAESEHALASHNSRIDQLQDELNQQRVPVHNQPPPDVTNAVSQPDVARSSRQLPPDIMPGQQQQQLDLVTASWFDNVADNQGNDWGDFSDHGAVNPPPPADNVDPQVDALVNQLREETGQLRNQISELESRAGYLDREKMVLEQSQTQLLADYKDLYDRFGLPKLILKNKLFDKTHLD